MKILIMYFSQLLWYFIHNKLNILQYTPLQTFYFHTSVDNSSFSVVVPVGFGAMSTCR